LAGRTTGSLADIELVSGLFAMAVARTFGNGISPLVGLNTTEFPVLSLGLLVPDGSEPEHPVTSIKLKYIKSRIILVFMALPLIFIK
jgi:hypothetical protein